MLPFLKRKPRILLLEDDVAMQRLVSTLLRRGGNRVDVVTTGAEALALVARNHYDALLLDLMMPHEGGITVIRSLRENRPDLVKRVVILSGSPDSILKSIDPDVFAVVRKPFEAATLMETVRRLTGKTTQQ